MHAIARIFDRIVNIFAWIGGAAAVVMMIWVTLDVTLRNVFHAPITGTLEIMSNYNMAALSFLPLAYIARERGHIIVELFTTGMKNNSRSILDGVIAIITLAYVSLFTWKAFEVALKKTEIRDAKESGFGFVEVWPARWFVVVGFGLMAVYVAFYMLRDLRRGFAGTALPYGMDTPGAGGDEDFEAAMREQETPQNTPKGEDKP